MVAEKEPQEKARKDLLESASELDNVLKRYLKLLGDDQGEAARLARSSHRDLIIQPAKRIHSAWKTGGPAFRGTAIEVAFERARFVERTEATRSLTDGVDDWPAWDESIRELSRDTQAFIASLQPSPEDGHAEALGLLQPLRTLYERYRDLVPFVDVAVVGVRTPVIEILSARITCTNQKPAEALLEKNGWIYARTSLPSERFPALLEEIASGRLELPHGSFRFPVSRNVNYGGFRTHTKMLGDPELPRATATYVGGAISNVVKSDAFYRWRERLAVDTKGTYYDVERLVSALSLRQPLTNADDYRQIALELEIPLRTHLVSLTREKFSLSFLLSSKKPAVFRGIALLKNDTTKDVNTVPLEINEDGYVLEWPTRTPSGSSSKIAIKVADDDGVILEESFETHHPGSFPFARTESSQEELAERDVSAVPRTRIRALQKPTPGAELTGTTVGPWALLQPIGSGGYGTVYEAQHEVTHFSCAVKIIPYDDEAVVVERLKRETRASNDVLHPAIVPIVDAGIDSDERVAYLAMRRLTGAPLASRLGSAIPAQDALKLLKPVFDALALFHERGVVHRDIHPGNIYLADGGQVHLLDFGLCAIVGRPRVTQPTTALGHLHYASPEQTMGWSDEAEATTDVWSLGVVLYELVTGKHPFARATDVAVASAAAHEAHPPAQTLGVSEAVARVIDCALQKRALDRFVSATELATAFEDAL